MSWGNYHQGPNGYGDSQTPDPWGRDGQAGGYEPSGYVNGDPYADPRYQQAYGGYGQAGYQEPGPAYSPPYASYTFAYDAAHPPRPDVGFLQAGQLFLKNYGNFYGRASLSEFWWAFLWQAIAALAWVIAIVATVAPSAATNSDPGALFWIVMVLGTIGFLALVVPSLSVQVRRLHDAGFSGFFMLFKLADAVYGIGSIVPFVLCFFPSKPHGVKYDNPDGSQPAVA